jgi:FkbM family methyltransferase
MKKRLTNAIGKTRLYHIYNRMFGKFDPRTIDFYIHTYSRVRRDIFFLQVGGNDGVTWDPLHYFVRRDRWRGVVIEPQRDVFEQRLKQTYKDLPGVQLMNVAVDVQDGERPLYKYAFTTARYATGAASLDKNMLIAAFRSEYIQSNIRREGLTVADDPDVYLGSEPVQCLSFTSILAKLQSDKIDFLCTDAEGFDVQILNTFPLDRIQPANIVFELPGRVDAALAAFLTKLRALHYDIHMTSGDAIAVRRNGAAS